MPSTTTRRIGLPEPRGRRGHRRAGAALGLSVLLSAAPAMAIQGGSAAVSGDALARATVGIGSITDNNGKPNFSRCSGVLISPQQVLTAAHCVSGRPIGVLVVFYKGNKPVKPVYTATVASRFSPDRGPLLSNEVKVGIGELAGDVAVLQLSQPVRNRAPVPLAVDPSRVPRSLELAGIGLSGNTGGKLNTTSLRPVAASSSGLTIARTRGSRVCFGDSGGPVVGRDARGVYVWGVASAVVSRDPPCGSTVVVAPASQLFSGGR